MKCDTCSRPAPAPLTDRWLRVRNPLTNTITSVRCPRCKYRKARARDAEMRQPGHRLQVRSEGR